MSDPADHGGWRHIVEGLVTAGRWVAKRDELPELEAVVSPGRRIAYHDELPKIEQIPSPGRSLKDVSSWLIAADELPLRTQTVRDKRHLLLSLFAFEPMPSAGPPNGTGTASFLRWLLKTEKLPPLPTDSPTKEASFDEP